MLPETMPNTLLLDASTETNFLSLGFCIVLTIFIGTKVRNKKSIDNHAVDLMNPKLFFVITGYTIAKPRLTAR